MIGQTKVILSIQSHVSWGHAGNSSAIFPLQRMGFEVVPIHTVHFSNHTGYPTFTGKVFDADFILDVFSGLEKRGFVKHIDGILTGYMGDKSICEAVKEIVKRVKSQNKDAIWLCDPVMGDFETGVYVQQGIIDMFHDKLIKHADIITPNQFEMEILSDIKITDDSSLKRAINTFANKVGIVSVTSYIKSDLEDDKIEIGICSHNYNNREIHIATTPRVNIAHQVSGGGDVYSALLLGHILNNKSVDSALLMASSSLYDLYELTKQNSEQNTKAGHGYLQDIALIEAQEFLINPKTKATLRTI